MLRVFSFKKIAMLCGIVAALATSSASAATHQQISGWWGPTNLIERENQCNPAMNGQVANRVRLQLLAFGNLRWQMNLHLGTGGVVQYPAFRNHSTSEVIQTDYNEVKIGGMKFNVNLRGSRPRGSFEYWIWCDRAKGLKRKFTANFAR